MFYQRILASRDKESVSAEIQTTVPKPEYEKIIKDPYVLEFLDLPANEHYYESELEQALIDHLQKFLLELGRGFSFVARQKHFDIDGRHFYIDLVFYNFITKCFVLIDLKTDDLTHQDIGQMQMYVNYYTRYMMNEGDNPPVGLLLSAQKSDTLVRLTLPENNMQIYAAKYMPYMRTEEELKRELNLNEFERKES
jgi:predicted nuclease of restriction endonuclease-like (RecB) superfamily